MPNRSVACSNPECGKRFVDIVGEGTIDIVRRGQQFVITPTPGGGFSMIGTCFACGEKTSLIVRDGKLVEDGIKFRDPKPPEDDPVPANVPPVDPTPPNEDVIPDNPELANDEPQTITDPVVVPDHQLTTVR